MKPCVITNKHIDTWMIHLRNEGYAPGTLEKYRRDMHGLLRFAAGQPMSKPLALAWKESMLVKGKAPVTVNGALAALNGFCAFMGWLDCRMRYIKVQRKLFRDASRELNREEYQRLVAAAQARRDTRLSLVLETICATGIRVSELRFITVEAARRRRADISLKGKVRTVLLPGKLCQKLLRYAQQQKTACGEIFLTAGGKSLHRRQIWGDMKGLCQAAHVAQSKVFPHNLRHLFARAFYRACKDVVRLADVLGHSSIDTTRIYLISTGSEHARLVDRLEFVR